MVRDGFTNCLQTVCEFDSNEIMVVKSSENNDEMKNENEKLKEQIIQLKI